MRELYGYSFFDESMLRELVWQPVDYVEIKNPISENYTRLVTTLQPNLLKAVRENSIACSQLRFYEWARVWRMHGNDSIEQKSLSGVFFDSTMNFYTGKALLMRMFDMLQMDVEWKPFEGTLFPWYASHETALIMHGGKTIGMAGMIDELCVATLSPAGGSLFVFEIDGDYLLDYKKPVVRFNSLSKYPSVRRDVSILINASITADTLINVIKSVDKQIEAVTLIDFFSKPDWENQKAMTFHVEVCDREKTLTCEVIEEIWGRVLAQLQKQGATIR
jgi:phenylalanyl-tRNA synthetase beta chain